MNKKLKWFLILLALGFAINIVSKNNSTPPTPEEKIQLEQKKQADMARKAYWEHPVIKGKNKAQSLAAINDKYGQDIQPAVQSILAFTKSNGKSPINVRLIANASIAFDNLAKAYTDFDVPISLPGDVAPLLTGARVSLKQSALAGTEAFLELQRVLENKSTVSMKVINAKMEEATRLRKEGIEKIAQAQSQLSKMTAPEEPTTNTIKGSL